MPQQMIWFYVSIAFSFMAWGMVIARYIWPRLRFRDRAEALRPLLILHSFRFIGLAFLVPGVVSPDLPSAFARSAAYGDVIAATLALLSLLSLPRGTGVVIAWIFNLWGTADLLNAYYKGVTQVADVGLLGAGIYIPALFVPILLTAHMLAFMLLLKGAHGVKQYRTSQSAQGSAARVSVPSA